jgi:hypothetical protein
VAVASFFSGQILSASGWNAVNYVVLPTVVVALASLLVLTVRARRVA